MAEVTVRSTDQVPALQLSRDGTAASGTLNARCDASGNMLVSLSGGGGGSTDVNIASVGGTATTLGQKAMAASWPVVIASNQSAVTISGTVTADAGTGNLGVNLTQIAGSSVSAAASGIPKVGLTDGSGSAVNKGSTTSAGSLPVVIASDQAAIAVTPAANSSVNVNQINGASVGATTFNGQLTISVTTSATVLLASNANRKGFILVNNGAVNVFLGNASVVSGATAQAAGGILLAANGGSISGDFLGGYSGAISGITAASTSVVGVWEW